MSGRKYENLLQFDTSWLASLRTWYYFRLCFSFSCSGYDLTLPRKSNTLNCYSFLHKFLLKTKITNSLLVTVIAQFTAKTTNSEKAIYFLSIMSFSINKLKSHLLFTYKNLCFIILCGKKVLLQKNCPCSPISLRSCIVLKDRPHHLAKYEGKGTKISIFKLFSELGKIWKCNLGFSKIPISHLFYELGKTWKYTQLQTNISKSKCWIYGWVRETYALI